jgi:hypothetical protein
MAEIKEFVINDRRKFTSEGELRPDAPRQEPRPPARPEPQPENKTEPESSKGPQLVPEGGAAEPAPESHPTLSEEDHQDLPALTAEQTAQASRAYDATVDRLDTAVRAMDPGGQHQPPMNFERLIQSLYMQTLIQLGGSPDPSQAAQVDLLGARATIDMMSVIADKTKGNLSDSENKLIDSALFEVRMGFLEVTQALAQQAAKRQGGPQMPPPPGGGPSIVR